MRCIQRLGFRPFSLSTQRGQPRLAPGDVPSDLLDAVRLFKPGGSLLKSEIEQFQPQLAPLGDEFLSGHLFERSAGHGNLGLTDLVSGDEFRGDGKLRGCQPHRFTSNRLRHTINFEQHTRRSDHGNP
jgi:hypothetical protein